MLRLWRDSQRRSLRCSPNPGRIDVLRCGINLKGVFARVCVWFLSLLVHTYELDMMDEHQLDCCGRTALEVVSVQQEETFDLLDS